jgi:pyruvate/2-oxoglutarate dehydrogenase complex dihydrolipoamide acyltransferase (E2) component
VVSKVDSKVVKLFARIGVKVNQGDVLIKLDESVVKKAINKAKSELTTAQERLSNYKILHASGAASDEEYKSAADEVKDAEENLVQNEARIADAIVMAPVGGTIAKLNVKSGDTTKVGMVLLEIDPSSGSSESTTKTNTTALSLSTDKPAYRNGEKMRCTLRVPVDGHLRLYSIDVNGDGTQIFPNRFEPDDRVRAGSTVHVPGNQAYDFTVERPEGLTRGTEALHAVLSADSFEADDAPLPEGENFRSVGRATPEQLRLRGVRVTAKPQTWTATVNYEIAP